MQRPAVILVEGMSDRAAVETLARRRGRDLVAEGVSVVAIGGASNIARFVGEYGPAGRGLRLAGLYDRAEVGYARRGLERAGLLPRYTDSRAALQQSAAAHAEMEAHGFFMCDADLEDELIRALGVDAVLAIVEREGELGAFRALEQQPAQRDRPPARQLHRFLGTRAGRKIRYGALLVAAVPLDRVPRPLDAALAHTG